MKGQTTIYRYDDEGNLSKVRVFGSKGTQIRLWRKGNVICYSVSRAGKLLYAMSLTFHEVKRRMREKAMRAVFYPFDRRTLLEIMAHLKKRKGHR